MASATEALKEKAGLVKKKPGFFDMLEAMKPQIAMALPRHLTPDRMIRIALTCCRLNPKLLECIPESLIAAIMISSQLGLEPGVLGQSFLVPFRQGKEKYVCQLIPGWLGILDLVSRSGKATAWTGAVYSGDQFDWALGDSPYLKHKPSGDETTLTHVYAIARGTNSQWPIIEVWPISKVWAHRDKINRVGDDHYSYKFPEQYARKVPLLQVLKYVPKSIELQAALSLDTAAETGGQVLSIKDVPALIEGTGAFTDVPELAQAKPEKKTAPIDEMCNECRTIGGHTPDCKYHPANQQAAEEKSKSVEEIGADLRKAVAAKNVPSEAARQPAGDGEGEQRHASLAPPSETAKAPAEKANPFKDEPFKKLVKMRKVEKKKSVDDKDYYKITAAEEDGGMVTMICWHAKTIGPVIYDRYAEGGLAAFLVREKRDKSKPYFEIDDVLSIGGKEYRDGKPVALVTDPDDETW